MCVCCSIGECISKYDTNMELQGIILNISETWGVNMSARMTFNVKACCGQQTDSS